jgi:5-methylcytosine-specific restriction endonuclease McrA
MSASSLRSARDRAATRQDGLCHYCELPMLLPTSPASKTMPAFVPSAEHLIARSEGGGNEAWNIVAAHAICNQQCHKRALPLPPDIYKDLVKSRLTGRWHPDCVLRRLRALQP